MASKVIIVTGASRGIGLALSTFLLEKPQSAKVVVIARGKQPLEDLQNKYSNDQVQVLAGDISDFSLGQKAVDLAISKWGKLDGIVLNHGTLGPVDRIANNDPKDWRSCFDVNLFSSIAFITAALPHLRESKGRIVLTSSGAASKHFTGWGAYGCSKAAIEHLALELPVEEPEIISVSVKPGVVDTEMMKAVRTDHAATQDAKDVELFNNLHKKGALLQPHQPGNVLARLVLGCPQELSGKNLTWDDECLKDFQDS
ncbi:MAG: hypothetical protein LQ352_004026 [Teloschistes flavicans]|nr:MAG: hypothetical protein LQ352_004026 [Teloschistes flavicans]